MANTIKFKRGSGSDPGTSDLSVGEIAIRTDTAKLFTKNDAGSVVSVSGGVEDGDKGDITVSSSGSVFTIDSGVVTSAKIANDTIVNADINSSAAIDGSKISPAFTSDITGTGNLTLTSTDAGSSAAPELELYRNSSSPADADYLGQLKFTGESDDGSKEVYAKITGKIDDASSGTEDGIIEIAHRKAGSNVITGRFKSTVFQLLNGTDLDVDGTITGNLTGNVTGNASGSSGSCTGNAATATALETARTIAGVSFDGTANISLNNNAITNGAGYLTSVGTSNIADGAVTAAKIASQTITADKIAADAVGTSELIDGAVTAAKIASQSITADRIAADAVGTSEIVDDAVTFAKIQNVSATNRILGRDSSGAGVIEEITPANLRTMINVEDGATADQSASEIVALIADQTIAPSTIDMEDNEKIKLGIGDDLELFHDGSDSHIDNNTGDLYLTTTGSGDDIHIRAVDDVQIKVQGSENAVICTGNGSVDLYYDGNKKLETTSDGIKVTDLVTDGEVNIMGTSDGNKYIDARVGSDSLQIRATSGGDSNHETMAKFFGNGSVELYHNASKKFETSSSGATITGTCTATTFAGSGTNITGIPAANLTGTASAINGSNITNLTAGNLTGTLPAIDGSNLTGISAGATGGGSDEIFYENGQNVTTDYTITNGKNAMSAGPITIDSGVTVTVGAGETLTIV